MMFEKLIESLRYSLKMNEYILYTKVLSKEYGSRIAVSNINLKLQKGDIYGLIGKNGAGKTTLLKMFSGLSKPTSGSMILNQKNLSSDGSNKPISVGTLIERPGLIPDMSAYDNLKLKEIFIKVKNKNDISELLKLVGLYNERNKLVKSFSVGMKQRLGIAMALVGNPDLMILDEPINGLDPQGIVDIRNLIIRLNVDLGITMIISSHMLSELSKVATKYGIINNGQLIREFTNDELQDECNSLGLDIESYFLKLTGGHTDV